MLWQSDMGLFTYALWRQQCKLQLTDAKRRPLSVLTLTRFLSHWNSFAQPR
jgi:hypothetical protein